jgi:hypothetical protein
MNIDNIQEYINREEFSETCEKAEQGDKNAALFVNKFMSELNILYFHLHNISHEKKVGFQILKLSEILENYFSHSKINHP